MFKKGVRKVPSNYGGINLLSTTLKFTSTIITDKINDLISLEYEQGFRSADLTRTPSLTGQIIEKSIEFNKPAYICCISLVKAFERVQLKNIIHLFYDRRILHNLLKTVEKIYKANHMKV